mmetsp:Transcript_111346/g.278794  ORF Transcript_111346/g.278794 Transcript_111346/m.278794 type:complete len:416 (+) Transcript_111346:61-1308(+)
MELQGRIADQQACEELQLLAADQEPGTSSVARDSTACRNTRRLAGLVLRVVLGLGVVLLCGAFTWSACGALSGSSSSSSSSSNKGSGGSLELPAEPRELPAVVLKHHDHSLENHTQPKRNSRRGSFLVIGDWGFDPAVHGNVPSVTCQQAIADRMREKMEELGDVKFVINVGDSFYPDGVSSKSDPQWENKWRKIYSKKVRSVPWYSVYGNHDYHHDPCACSEDPTHCAQVNANVSNLDYFVMPDVSYYLPHPELDMEIVGLDLNTYVLAWNRAIKNHELEDCQYSPCPAQCKQNAHKRTLQAFDLFHTRRKESTAKNLLVFSHYPTDYFGTAPHFMEGLRDASKRIVYFGGHRHDVDQSTTAPIHPNVNWLVGGGGGWSCDGGNQGFVVGEISDSFEVHTYSVLVSKDTCCAWR